MGEHDAAINADAMRATYLTGYPDCQLEVIPNAGHYPMQETPVFLATLIQSFMLDS
ncbi:MAG: alpha/beta hydrolase [Thiolinea sp.]